jgi:hypothetical protein
MKSMKLQTILIAFVALIVLSTSIIIVAQESTSDSTSINAGIAPSATILYELDVTFDNIRLMIASIRGPKAHSELALIIAQERIAEIEYLANKGNIVGMRRSIQEYKKLMDVVHGRSQDIVKINSMNEITLQIGLSQSLAEHRKFVNNISNTLKINIENNENIDEKDQQQIISLLNDMRQSTESAEIKLENIRNETKKEIVQRTDKDLKEINLAVNMIEREQGFTELRNRAQHGILDAIIESMALDKFLNALSVSDQYILNTTDSARNELSLARISYKNGDYNAAINHASMSITLFEIVFTNLDAIKELKFDENIVSFKMIELAQKEINSTTREIINAQNKKSERNITSELILTTLNNANVKLIEAETAFNNGNYLKAYIYAIESNRLTDAANVQIDEFIIESMTMDTKQDIFEKRFDARYEILSATKEFKEVQIIVGTIDKSDKIYYLMEWAENRLDLAEIAYTENRFTESLTHSTTSKRMLDVITEKIDEKKTII